jgi:hypothetical protein
MRRIQTTSAPSWPFDPPWFRDHIHEADWKGTGPYDDTKEWARRYWRGDIMPHPETNLKLREVLTLSRLRIDGQA